MEQITFTRFLAAISIVIFHFGQKGFFHQNESISFLSQSANLGVSYFYLLSGFIMIIAYFNKKEVSTLEYYQNRLARVYPTYLFAFIFFFIVVIDPYINLKTIVLNVLTLQAWVPGRVLSYNLPGWSISVEMFFFLCFPLLLKLYKSGINSKIYFIIIPLIWLITQVLTNYIVRFGDFDISNNLKLREFIYYNPIMHINEFLLGNLAGIFFIRKMKPGNYDVAVVVTVALCVLTIKFVPLEFHNGLLAIVFVPLIILICANTGLITKVFNHKILVYLGSISYSLYIIQYPLHILFSQFSEKYAFIESHSFYYYVILLIICSILSYELIENPCRKIFKRKRKVVIANN
ncbi:acyltransferase [Chryseobacterium indologenes]|uniref:acyltransferase family protein n=1 Tax=Chryseobacterium indologenes TaxID=253 RepID=UPI000F4F4FC1|nr:acyltransferase [Chryseobacterium indologenes]AYY85942.1 acyltransferase [Chryseobacterium indologenes]